MCTVCGHYVKGGVIPSDDIHDMLVKMSHRGPDTHGLYLDGLIKRAEEIEDLKTYFHKKAKIALGHSRLKIIGSEERSQPYTSCDNKLILIHNGEIYNYQKLRALLARDHEFKTTSDSEVIVHLIEEVYKDDLTEAVIKILGLLDGMYVLAVTDGKKVVVARDPIGKKPLYYIQNGDVTYFASEKKALWNGKDEPLRLMPGHVLELSDKGLKIFKGYELQLPQIDIVDFREAVDMYKEAIVNAVRKRLSGLQESTIGVIFSGGIDSVLVAHLLQREGKNIKCYCTGTPNSGDIVASEQVAKELGFELKTAIIDEATVESILPEVIRNVEESGLLQVEVAIPMYLAAQMASEDDIRVMFTGQAADELFAGYPWYNEVVREDGYIILHEKLWEDLNYLYKDTLEREDKLTMSHSIELRAPYLDRDVITTAMRIAPNLKIDGPDDNLRKRVHRQAAVELGVPPSVAFRKKDPAQSGSGIHEIIEALAHKNVDRVKEELVEKNIDRDKGSLYRYGEDEYGDEIARFYLQKIAEEIKKRYIPAFLKQESMCH